MKVEYCYLLNGHWTRVSEEMERGEDGKVHVQTLDGAVLDYFFVTETWGTRSDSFIAAPTLFQDVVFEDATLLERTYAWVAGGRKAEPRCLRCGQNVSDVEHRCPHGYRCTNVSIPASGKDEPLCGLCAAGLYSPDAAEDQNRKQ